MLVNRPLSFLRRMVAFFGSPLAPLEEITA
jgi:hypothetical protein